MANILEQRKKYFRDLLGRELTPEDLVAVGGESNLERVYGSSPLAQYEEIMNSPEYLSRVQEKAKSRYAPELEQVGLEEEQARKQAEIAGKGFELEKKGISETKSQLEYDLEDAIKNIKKQQKEQEIGFLNQQQRLRIRPSGLTVGGLGELATETGTQISRLERTRANKLAQIALQENELTLRGEATQGTLASSLRQTQIRRGGIEQNISETKQGLIDQAKASFEKAIADNDAEEFNRAIKLIDLANQTPEGQEVDLGQYGKIRGTKAVKPVERKTETIIAGGRQLLIDSATGETIRDLGGAYKATGRGKETSKSSAVSDNGFYNKKQGINTIKEAKNRGISLTEVLDELNNSPLSTADRSALLSYIEGVYQINISEPRKQQILKKTGTTAKKSGSSGIKRSGDE